MGLGKTRQALAALSHAAPVGQVLIVCPARSSAIGRAKSRSQRSRARSTSWRGRPSSGSSRCPLDHRQLRHPRPPCGRDRRGAVGGSHLRRSALPEEPHEREEQGRPRVASKAAAVAKKEPPVYLLTGTPLTNRPRDLFVLLQLVGHPLGRSFPRSPSATATPRRPTTGGRPMAHRTWRNSRCSCTGRCCGVPEEVLHFRRSCGRGCQLPTRRESPPARCVRSWTCSSRVPLVIWKQAISAPHAPARDPDEGGRRSPSPRSPRH